ncbi:MAG: dienelactone hydrolase [Gammaproteobacteria bacterium]|nr:dienelactone hydrolase [Gammaproteobacteria bacterium]
MLVVFTSCGLAFVISHQTQAATTANAPDVATELKHPYESVGQYQVEQTDESWRDGARDRTVPVRIFSPKANTSTTNDAASLFPIILFSHGLGGSKAGGKAWGEHWASHGFIVVHMQHGGSDESVWKGKREADVVADMKSAMSMNNLGLRVGDVHFAIDEIIKRAHAKNPLFIRADTSKIGMSGHSFGAQTTFAVAGQNSPNVRGQTGLDKRIKAAIALSPNARNKTNLDKQFGDIRIPFFSITGTLDGEVLNDKTEPIHRTLPYKHMSANNKYLLVLADGDHTIFGGHNPGARRGTMPRDNEIKRLVKSSSLAFWQATLNADAKAVRWLQDSKVGFKSALLTTDIFEFK